MFCIALLDQSSQAAPAGNDPETMTKCREILGSRAAQDESLRKGFFDLGGNRVALIDARQGMSNQAVALLFKYVTTPAGKAAAATAERKRRIALVRAAGTRLGLTITAADVQELATAGDPFVVSRIIEMLRQIETDDTGKAALQMS